jgi:type IV pilus assembly protein PilM
MFFGQKKVVALDIGTSSIKLAEVETGRRGTTLTRFAIYPLEPGWVNGGEIVDIPAVGQAIEALVRQTKTKRKCVSTGMWGSSVIVKKIAMPKMDEALVPEQIKWEAEQYIPFDVNEISLEHHVLKGRSETAESMEVLLVAAKQEFVFRIMEAIEIAGMKCSVIDVSGFSLANCFEENYGSVAGTVALLNIGAGVTNFVVVEKGEVVFCRDIAVGGLNYTSDINKAMGISLGEAEALKISASMGQEVPDEVNSIITSTNEQVVDEIKNSFEFFTATSNGATINQVYLCGGCIFTPGLVEQLAGAVGINCDIINPFQRISYDTKAFSPDYIAQIKSISPVALGLAMRKLTD